MSKNNRFLEGIVLGAVVGAVAGLLLAPRTGRETRDKLKQFSHETANTIKEKIETPKQMVHKTLEAIEEGFGKVSAMVTSRTSRNRPTDRE